MNEWQSPRAQFLPRIIVISFVLAVFLAIIPLPHAYFFWLPDWPAMVLFFWVINRPHSVNLGVAFTVGLILDIAGNMPLGEHSLAYCLSAFLILLRQKQIIMYGFGIQSLIIFALLMFNQVIIAVVWGFYGQAFVGWLYFISPLCAALIWPPFNKLMFYLFYFTRR